MAFSSKVDSLHYSVSRSFKSLPQSPGETQKLFRQINRVKNIERLASGHYNKEVSEKTSDASPEKFPEEFMHVVSLRTKPTDTTLVREKTHRHGQRFSTEQLISLNEDIGVHKIHKAHQDWSNTKKVAQARNQIIDTRVKARDKAQVTTMHLHKALEKTKQALTKTSQEHHQQNAQLTELIKREEATKTLLKSKEKEYKLAPNAVKTEVSKKEEPKALKAYRTALEEATQKRQEKNIEVVRLEVAKKHLIKDKEAIERKFTQAQQTVKELIKRIHAPIMEDEIARYLSVQDQLAQAQQQVEKHAREACTPMMEDKISEDLTVQEIEDYVRQQEEYRAIAQQSVEELTERLQGPW